MSMVLFKKIFISYIICMFLVSSQLFALAPVKEHFDKSKVNHFALKHLFELKKRKIIEEQGLIKEQDPIINLYNTTGLITRTLGNTESNSLTEKYQGEDSVRYEFNNEYYNKSASWLGNDISILPYGNNGFFLIYDPEKVMIKLATITDAHTSKENPRLKKQGPFKIYKGLHSRPQVDYSKNCEQFFPYEAGTTEGIKLALSLLEDQRKGKHAEFNITDIQNKLSRKGFSMLQHCELLINNKDESKPKDAIVAIGIDSMSLDNYSYIKQLPLFKKWVSAEKKLNFYLYDVVDGLKRLPEDFIDNPIGFIKQDLFVLFKELEIDLEKIIGEEGLIGLVFDKNKVPSVLKKLLNAMVMEQCNKSSSNAKELFVALGMSVSLSDDELSYKIELKQINQLRKYLRQLVEYKKDITELTKMGLDYKLKNHLRDLFNSKYYMKFYGNGLPPNPAHKKFDNTDNSLNEIKEIKRIKVNEDDPFYTYSFFTTISIGEYERDIKVVITMENDRPVAIVHIDEFKYVIDSREIYLDDYGMAGCPGIYNRIEDEYFNRKIPELFKKLKLDPENKFSVLGKIQVPKTENDMYVIDIKDFFALSSEKEQGKWLNNVSSEFHNQNRTDFDLEEAIEKEYSLSEKNKIHGYMHIYRCLLIAGILCNIYNKYAKQCNVPLIEFSFVLKAVIAFHDAGRQGQEGPDLSEGKSKAKLKKFLKEKWFCEEEIDEVLNNFFINYILKAVDSLDIMRPCTGHGGIAGFDRDLFVFLDDENDPLVAKLASEERERIREDIITNVWEFIRLSEDTKESEFKGFVFDYRKKLEKLFRDNMAKYLFLEGYYTETKRDEHYDRKLEKRLKKGDKVLHRKKMLTPVTSGRVISILMRSKLKTELKEGAEQQNLEKQNLENLLENYPKLKTKTPDAFYYTKKKNDGFDPDKDPDGFADKVFAERDDRTVFSTVFSPFTRACCLALTEKQKKFKGMHKNISFRIGIENNELFFNVNGKKVDNYSGITGKIIKWIKNKEDKYKKLLKNKHISIFVPDSDDMDTLAHWSLYVEGVNYIDIHPAVFSIDNQCLFDSIMTKETIRSWDSTDNTLEKVIKRNIEEIKKLKEKLLTKQASFEELDEIDTLDENKIVKGMHSCSEQFLLYEKWLVRLKLYKYENIFCNKDEKQEFWEKQWSVKDSFYRKNILKTHIISSGQYKHNFYEIDIKMP